MAHSRDKKISDDSKDDFFAFKREVNHKHDDYYGGKRKPRCGCTCATLAILFLAFLIALCVMLILATRSPNGLSRIDTSGSIVSTAAEGDVIAQQLAQNAQNTDSQITLVLTEKELSARVNAASPGSKVAIRSEGVALTSVVYGFDAYGEFQPKIENNQLIFETKSASIGSLKVPRFASYSLSSTLNQALRGLTKDLATVNLTGVELQPGAMMLTGRVVGR